MFYEKALEILAEVSPRVAITFGLLLAQSASYLNLRPPNTNPTTQVAGCTLLYFGPYQHGSPDVSYQHRDFGEMAIETGIGNTSWPVGPGLYESNMAITKCDTGKEAKGFKV